MDARPQLVQSVIQAAYFLLFATQQGNL
jgi:hypothetical protein